MVVTRAVVVVVDDVEVEVEVEVEVVEVVVGADLRLASRAGDELTQPETPTVARRTAAVSLRGSVNARIGGPSMQWFDAPVWVTVSTPGNFLLLLPSPC